MGIGYTLGFYRDHFGAHCGMEVVLPNGELMRTGMGALPTSGSWQEYRHGYGPDPSGLFGQGNFGIVTKMGFRLMPQPEHWRNGLVTVPKRHDFIALVDTVNYLTDLGIIRRAVVRQSVAALVRNTEFKQAGGTRSMPKRWTGRRQRRACIHSRWNCSSTGRSAPRSRTGSTQKSSWHATFPARGSWMASRCAVPLTKEAESRAPPGRIPPALRRNVTQGVPGLGIWYQTGRTEQNPNAWNETHIGLFSLVARSGEAVFKAQRDFADIAKKLQLPSQFSNAVSTPVNWYQFGFLMGNSFGVGGGDNSPRRQAEGHATAATGAAGERHSRLRRLPRAADAAGRRGGSVLLQQSTRCVASRKP